MAQVKTIKWTNAASAVARDQDVGFTVAEATTVDTTNGGSWYWNNQMDDASYLDVDAGTITTTNGFTPLSESSNYGATISAFTNANPGVITVDDTALYGFAAGDTISVDGIAESGSGATLNAQYTIASITATTITTGTNTTSGAVWVSGGKVTRVSDSSGAAIPIENLARRGITVGTGPVGANSAVMVMVCRGDESVT
jgi:hypothetical protein